MAERVGFLITDLDGKDGSHFVSASPRDDVTWFQWVNDDWLVFRVNDPNYRGSYAVGAGLMVMSRDGKSSRQLVSREWEQSTDVLRRKVLSPDHRYLGLSAPGSSEVLVSEPHYDTNYEYKYATLHALNIMTGQARSVESAPRADNWLLDGKGRPRAAMLSSAGQTTVMWADPKSGAWVELLKAPSLHMPWTPLAIKDETHLLVSTVDQEGYEEIREYDAVQRQLGAKPILTTPGFSDSISPIQEWYSDKLLGLLVNVDGLTITWFDPTMNALQTRIDNKFAGRVNTFSCGRSCANAKRVLVHSYSDTDPGMTLLFLPETDEWQLVGRERPEIDPQRMASMELLRTKARDGEDLPLWITRAPNVSAEKPAPAIMLIHGGPWVRGVDWEWGSERQFLASRGYLVIEPEFRGSAGYGDEHFKKGFKQWGLKMQDDISDALKFAVQKGWADPKRVCIMGTSYGGYATLMGLIKDPDQYRCGVAFAAVSDPRNMFDFFWSDIPDEAKAYGMKELLGDRVKDEAQFIATSPVEQAARLKSPLLLVHGEKDRRVPLQNGERMRDALKKYNKPVEWVSYPWAAHGFPKVEDELDFYRRVEKFLAQNLR